MKALVLLSGGVDSSTCLALAKEKYGDEVLALSMSYGQKHSREVQSARAIRSSLRSFRVRLLLPMCPFAMACSWQPRPASPWNMAVT